MNISCTRYHFFNPDYTKSDLSGSTEYPIVQGTLGTQTALAQSTSRYQFYISFDSHEELFSTFKLSLVKQQNVPHIVQY